MTTPILQVIIASTRPGRVGLPVAEWFADLAKADGKFSVEVVDLAEIALPLLDEPNHPRLQQYTKPHTRHWSEVVSRADAFVFVHPEYNSSINAALKNALDFLQAEWRHKPMTLVSYGGVSAGLRGAIAVKQVATALGMIPVTGAVSVPFVTAAVEDGRFIPTDTVTESAFAALADLRTLVDAMRP